MSLEERKATTKELLVTLKAKSEAEAQKIADEMDFSWTDTYAEKEKKPRRPKKLKEAGKSLKRKKEKKGKGGENGESGGAGMKRGRDEMEVDEELSIEDYLGERIKKLRI